MKSAPFSLILLGTLTGLLTLSQCNPSHPKIEKKSDAEKDSEQDDIGLVRINSDSQSYIPRQPWQKTESSKRQGLGVLVGKNQVLTTAEMVANTTYIELESADKRLSVPAEIHFIDYEANLALLGPEDGDDASFLDELIPFDLAPPVTSDKNVTIWQLEKNGMATSTLGKIRAFDVLSTFAGGHYFLSYSVKSSLQSASNSFTLPVTKDGKLLGLLSRYNSADQISDVIAPEVVKHFLDDAADGSYEGFPSLGAFFVSTQDPNFRKWLQLSDDLGGLYVARVLKNTSASDMGLETGDVILSVNGQDIDRRGYYAHPNYGRLYWGHLLRGSSKIGDTLTLNILRKGTPMELSAPQRRTGEPLIPDESYDSPPDYFIKGGLLFQELTRPFLESFGDKWHSVAPLSLLDALANPQDYKEGRNRIVILSRSIPTQATVGYEAIRHKIITKVNGQKIADLADLEEAFKNPAEGLHRIEFEEIPYVIFLDEATSSTVDAQLLKSGLPALKRLQPN